MRDTPDPEKIIAIRKIGDDVNGFVAVLARRSRQANKISSAYEIDDIQYAGTMKKAEALLTGDRNPIPNVPLGSNQASPETAGQVAGRAGVPFDTLRPSTLPPTDNTMPRPAGDGKGGNVGGRG